LIGEGIQGSEVGGSEGSQEPRLDGRGSGLVEESDPALQDGLIDGDDAGLVRSSVPATFRELHARSLTFTVVVEATVDSGRGKKADGLHELGMPWLRIHVDTELRIVVHIPE
jgi:hypothetical protein